jgi:DNA-binding MarR family transcriptional regulator
MERKLVKMQRSELHIDSFLPTLIRNLSEGMALSMSRRITGPFRLTMTEWRILLQLAEHEALTASDIVDYSAMEKSKVSRAIKSLEARDLVTRQVAENDHRVKRLAMTETGRKRYRALVPRILDWEKELIEGLEVGEYRDLLYLLDKLQNRLQGLKEAPKAKDESRGNDIEAERNPGAA